MHGWGEGDGVCAIVNRMTDTCKTLPSLNFVGGGGGGGNEVTVKSRFNCTHRM